MKNRFLIVTIAFFYSQSFYGQITLIDSIPFNDKKASLSLDGWLKLNAITQELKNCACDYQISIKGIASDSTNLAYGRRLAIRRSENIAEYLAAMGLAAYRIEQQTYRDLRVNEGGLGWVIIKTNTQSLLSMQKSK